MLFDILDDLSLASDKYVDPRQYPAACEQKFTSSQTLLRRISAVEYAARKL